MARRISALPLLLVLSYRDNKVRPELQHLLALLDREHHSTELVLPRFARAEVGTMVQAIKH